jgi:hypothetical protein
LSISNAYLLLGDRFDLVLEHDPQQLYVGHGGPNVCADHVRRRVDSIAPPD